jgi:hypothetical protein
MTELDALRQRHAVERETPSSAPGSGDPPPVVIVALRGSTGGSRTDLLTLSSGLSAFERTSGA